MLLKSRTPPPFIRLKYMNFWARICLKFKHFISQVRNPGQSSHKPGKRLQSSCHLNHLLLSKCKTGRSRYGRLWTSILTVKCELGFSFFPTTECYISCFWRYTCPFYYTMYEKYLHPLGIGIQQQRSWSLHTAHLARHCNKQTALDNFAPWSVLLHIET